MTRQFLIEWIKPYVEGGTGIARQPEERTVTWQARKDMFVSEGVAVVIKELDPRPDTVTEKEALAKEGR